jgi:DNA polymerase-3 subunit beta
MRLIVKQKTLEKALSRANWIIEKKQTIPILGYILLCAEKARGLTITSTNMDMMIVDNLQCDIVEEGTYCLQANLLYDIVRKFRAGVDVLFYYSADDNSIHITSNKASFSIHHMEKDGFPPMAEADYQTSFTMSTKLLKKSIDIAKVAMLQDNSRFHLNGIHIHHENELGINRIRFVATDLFRIACVSADAPPDIGNMEPIIISKRTVTELLKLMDGGSSASSVRVSISENRILFVIEAGEDQVHTEFSARLINGTFPEYRAALDVTNDKILVINTSDFVESLERVGTIVTDSTNSVRLRISQDKVVLTGVSREFGSAVDEIDATFSSLDPMDICFNSKYLLDILKQIETPQVRLLLAESSSSTIVGPTDSSERPEISMTFAVMPIEIVAS